MSIPTEVTEKSFKNRDIKLKVSDEFKRFLNMPELEGCKGCTACCFNQNIYLFENCGDSIKDYKCHTDKNGFWLLDHKPVIKGLSKCTYLGESKCTIYDKRPSVCRQFDCAETYVMLIVQQEATHEGINNAMNSFIATFGMKVLEKAAERLKKSGYSPKDLPTPEEIHDHMHKFMKENNIKEEDIL